MNPPSTPLEAVERILSQVPSLPMPVKDLFRAFFSQPSRAPQAVPQIPKEEQAHV